MIQAGQLHSRNLPATTGFRCTDYYQAHYHYDVGSFVIYRNGLLAVDAGRYTSGLYGPQAQTDAHNTLLIGGQGQRKVQGQWYKDLSAFAAALSDRRPDRRLERGDVPFYTHAGAWTAVAGQFAQAYPAGLVESCVRQLLFVRPRTVVVVDHLVAPAAKKVPAVTWMLHVPTDRPTVGPGTVTVSNERSWLRCRDLTSTDLPAVEKSLATQLTGDFRQQSPVSRVNFICKEEAQRLTLVHLLEVGDDAPPFPVKTPVHITSNSVSVTPNDGTYVFSLNAPLSVSRSAKSG